MIPAPNFTQSPNVFFDGIFKNLKEGELRIVLVIIRQTFGWHKAADRISISQLSEKSGMERKSVCRSLNSLIEKGLVTKKKFGENGKERCYFSLTVDMSLEDEEKDYDDDISEEEMAIISNSLYQCPKDTPPVSEGHHPQCPKDKTPSVLKTPTKETITKETIQKKQQQQTAQKNQTSDNSAYSEQKESSKSAAASFCKEPQKQKSSEPQKSSIPEKPKIYSCLKGVDIPESDKIEITGRYSEDVVKNSIAWATHPQTKISKTLVQATKWACQNKPSVPKQPQDEESSNQQEALKLLKRVMKPSNVVIEINHKYIEIIANGSGNGGVPAIYVNFSDKGFIQQLESALRKVGCVIKPTNL